jgi:hypothetical protein
VQAPPVDDLAAWYLKYEPPEDTRTAFASDPTSDDDGWECPVDMTD